MFNAHVSDRASSKPAIRVRQIGQSTFWVLFAIVGLFMAGMVLLALYVLLPPRAPLAQSSDYKIVRAALEVRLSGASADPLVEVAPGVSAPASNVGGFTLNGYTYYYYREGQVNYDPLSRGSVARTQVELVSREAFGGNIVVFYRVPSKDRARN